MVTLKISSVLIVCLYLSSVQAKVPVSVYYESLCPDSIAFFTKQLYPAVKNSLSKYIDLNLIPYGKSSQEYMNNNWQFTCHHGPNECHGNRIQACALALIHNEQSKEPSPQAIDYINCLMSTYDRNAPKFTYPSQQCAETNNIQNVTEIERCANSSEGATHLSHLGVLTKALKPELRSVPTIVFENVYNEEDQQLALKDFEQALCRHIVGEKPEKCITQSSGSTIMSIKTLIFFALFATFTYMK